MKKHTQIYMNHFGYDINDFISCEVCGGRAVDIHHIEARGSGGDPQGKKDTIENLMAVCRPCHIFYGDKKQYKDYLKDKHNKALNGHTGS